MSHPLHWGAVASKSKTLTREAKELSEGKEIFKEEWHYKDKRDGFKKKKQVKMTFFEFAWDPIETSV